MTADHSPPPALSLSDVAFTWPDGTALFDALSLSVPSATYSLLGANGAGKSTLLELIAGLRQPVRGSVSVAGEVAFVPQNPVEDADRTATIADTLGIASRVAALRRIEAGSVDAADFDAVGDDWDIEARAAATVAGLGLPTDLTRRVDTLSGGEATLLAIAARLLTRPAVLLLDEPTNNLDIRSRELLFRAIDAFTGTIVVVSHDLTLLERVEVTLELYRGRLRTFGGPYSLYRETLDAEQRAAQAAATTAANTLAGQRRDLNRAQQTLARRQRTAAKAEREKRVPKMLAHGRRDAAQVSAGKYRREHQDGVQEAEQRLTAARDEVRKDRDARIDMPAVSVASSAQIVVDDRLPIVGPERVALVGPNGSGKTTLIRSLIDTVEGDSPAIVVPYAYVPQQIHLGAPDSSLVDALWSARPSLSHQQVRAHLARFLFRGTHANRTVGELSGGERVRAALALASLTQEQPRLLILDEPTNNLDIDTVEQVVLALDEWRGALIVVSHDEQFRRRLGLDREVDVTSR